MAVRRLDNILIVVRDLDHMIAFFETIGLELEGRGPVEGEWVEQVIGVSGVRQEIAMLRTPDGTGRVELAAFEAPEPIDRGLDRAPAHTLGLRRIMFAVDDIDADLDRLTTFGAELVGEVVQYAQAYRLCYLRGPEGVIVGLAQQLEQSS